MKIFNLCILVVSMILPVQGFSAVVSSDISNLSAKVQASAEKDVATLKQALAKRLPTIKVDSVSATPISGLYQVVVGSQVVYMDVNAEYMLDGDMVNLKTKKNYSEDAKAKIRLSVLNELGKENMLIYKPEKVEHQITVVTDIDCPYCRRLHEEVGEYLDNNVEVRYIFMPLKGESDRKKTESVWCADNKQDALDIAKAGGDVDPKTCDNPLDKQMDAARKLGVRGTPAIILEDGEMLPGYIPVKKLVTELRKN